MKNSLQLIGERVAVALLLWLVVCPSAFAMSSAEASNRQAWLTMMIGMTCALAFAFLVMLFKAFSSRNSDDIYD